MVSSYSKLNSSKIKKKSSENVIDLVLDTIESEKQVVIFNNSKNSSEATAEKISKYTKIHSKDLEELSEKILNSLQNPTKQCIRLSKCVKAGVAFHHSGLVAKQRNLIEEAFRKGLIKVISSTPTLCLAKGTKVWTDSGLVPIENLKEQNVFGLKDFELKFIKPEKTENNGKINSFVEIESVSGHKIRCSRNHKFLVKRNGIDRIVIANEIKKTDLIATIGNIDFVGSKVSYSDFIKENEFKQKEAEITKEVYYLIGAMLGDGYSGAENKDGKIFYKGSPCIVGVDNEVFEEVYKARVSLNFSIRECKNYNGIPQLILSKNNWFREFLCRAGVDLGSNKFISDNLKFSEKEKISNLLRGLFDTDGYVERRGHIGYSSISEKLINDIQQCLYRFNIVSRIRKRKKKTLNITGKVYECKESFELLISENSSIYKFYEEIGFTIKRKQNSLKRIVDKISNNIHTKTCRTCGYTLYKDLFGGRNMSQKKWGEVKLKVIQKLFSYGTQSSNNLKEIVGCEIRKNERRLNHHYELIEKKRFRNYDWNWSLNEIGRAVGSNLTSQSYEMIFNNQNCIVCKEKLQVQKKKTWKNKNKEGDIYWDQIRRVDIVFGEEIEVFDVVLPSDRTSDHLFVAEGFITHNSAGLNLPAYKVIVKDYKRYSPRGFNDIPVLEYHQMSGRAGRPGIEDVGKAVLVVKSDDELERTVKKYIFGKPEEIISKLAVEPTLKMYILSLVSMDMINSKEEIEDFFKNTLYAYQYKDLDGLYFNIFRILDILKEYDFISQDDDYYVATPIGKKISELYLNPDTANYFLENIDKFFKEFSKENIRKEDIFKIVSFISDTVEMRPLFRVGKPEQEEYMQKIEEMGNDLVVPFNPFESDYVEFMNVIKTTQVFVDWVYEAPEDYISDKYKVTPGELNYKLDVVDWLLYCLEEISLMKKNFYFRNLINKLRVRFKAGVKEELLPLITLSGIGRVRARKLYNSGFKKIVDLRKAELSSIGRIIGEKMAIRIKSQINETVDSSDTVLKFESSKPKEMQIREVTEEEVLQLVVASKDFEKEREKSQTSLTEFF